MWWRIAGLLCLLLSWQVSAAAAPALTSDTLSVTTLCYHDVRDDVDADIDRDPNAVSSRQLAAQFEWLRQNGYTPVSIAQLDAARRGTPLPPKAVLLTFDDGYVSFYTRIFPLLKLYRYPAVMALVGSWLDVPANKTVAYGTEHLPRNGLLSVAQIREMQDSGLVTFASHTYEQHRGVLGNPQGNEQPAVVTREYDKRRGRYETEAEMTKRIQRDIEKNHRRLQAWTGVAPRVMVWPYGEWNVLAENVARKQGYEWFLLLGDQPTSQVKRDGRVYRHLLMSNPDIGRFAAMVEPVRPLPEPVRAAHVDMDYVYDRDPVQLQANLNRLLERIKHLRISTVYLQAFADPDGDGNADAMYFPNRSLPVRADLFNRVAWQLRTRAGVKVYAWMPVLALDYGAAFYREHGVQQWAAGRSPIPATNAYRRLSVFDPVARERIIGLYQDLAAHAAFYGVLFHDDALLDQDEYFHPAAQAWFPQRGLDLTRYADWQSDPAQRRRFTLLKTQALEAFTDTLMAAVRVYRPEARSARNVYAAPVLSPESANWFAQDLYSALQHYDHVALMAMPWMEKANDPEAWTLRLIDRLATLNNTQRQRVIIELQARDWHTDQPISATQFARQVQLWQRAGYRHFAWYPDDFIANVPEFNTLYRLLSLEDYPYEHR